MHLPRRGSALPLILPVISRPLMRVQRRLFRRASPARIRTHRTARPASPEYFSLHVHARLFFFLSSSLSLFFLSISISIRTYTREQQRTRAHRERSDAHAHKERQRGRKREGERERAALANPARNFYHRRSYHRRIHECCREFCIMHGPRSAELPA